MGTSGLWLLPGLLISGLVAHAADAPAIGQAPPPLALDALLNAPPGASLDWRQLRGKVVVLEFFATWCGPCIKALPHANEMVDTFDGDELRYVLLNNQERGVIEAFIAANRVAPWVALDRRGETHAAYSPAGLPTAYLIGPDGRVAAITHPSHITAEVIRDVLAGKPVDLPVSESVVRGDPEWDRGVACDGDAPDALAQVVLQRSASRFPGVRDEAESGRIVADGITLEHLAALAYGVQLKHVEVGFHAPERYYRISVTAPPREGEPTARAMLREVLERALRYRPVWHEVEHEVAVLRRAPGRPLRLTRSEPGKEGGARWIEDGATLTVEMRSTDMEFLGALIDRRELELGRKWILDETGLEGDYDLDLSYTAGDLDSLRDALRELGLDLVRETRNVPLLTLQPE